MKMAATSAAAIAISEEAAAAAFEMQHFPPITPPYCCSSQVGGCLMQQKQILAQILADLVSGKCSEGAIFQQMHLMQHLVCIKCRCYCLSRCI